MTIDVTAERVAPLPSERVTAYAMDGRHDAEWTQGIRTAEPTREADGGGFGVGAEVTRTAYFPGRRIEYLLRVAANDPPRPLDMISVAGAASTGRRRRCRPGRWGAVSSRIRAIRKRDSWNRDEATMAYDEGLAQRIRERLGAEPAITEKRMFGGIAFLWHGNMAVGVTGDDLMVRVGPDATDAALARPGARLFDMTGRPMRGWVVVDGAAVEEDEVLGAWLAEGCAFAASLPPK